MFQFQSGELSFQISNNLENITNTNTNTTNTSNTHLFHQTNQTLLPLKSNKSPKTRKGKSKNTTINDYTNYITNDNNEDVISGNDIVAKRKIIHREVERQRRQEMSTLHSSLRSLLPMEYIRGKRSICDHVTEATKYIKDLEKNIKELEEKRDKLKESFSSLENQLINNNNNIRDNNNYNNNNLGCSSSSSSSNTSDYNVSIHKFSRTLQIEITTGVGEEDPYPLSKILNLLDQEGLDVVSYVSSIVNQRWIYVIYCEVDEAKSMDSCHLQEKLMSVISSCDL